VTMSAMAGPGLALRRTGRSLSLAVVLAVAIPLLGSLPAVATTAGQTDLEIRTISNRADLISGGDVLVEVVLPAGATASGLTVDVGGRDVSASFVRRDDGRLLGLVDGLAPGATVLTAALPDGRGARLEVTNHVLGGPIFAGPQVLPWPCATLENGLGEPLDEQCNAATILEFFYWSNGSGAFEPYDPEAPPSESDVATTTTDEGVTVPYIVRRERGVIDRGIYDVAVLFDPASAWDPFQPQPGWNGKLYWPFGGSCQPYHGQVPPGARPDVGGAPGVLDDNALSRGFMVASSGFSVLGNNCSTIVSAEALMMVKEHLIEEYGPIRFTFGQGGSGGSIQQLQIAGAYPGLLDGLTVDATFADLLTTANENLDCRLLVHYFARTSPQLWTSPQEQLVQGHGSLATCHAWISIYGFPAMLADPSIGCRVALLTYTENDVWGVQGMQQEPEWVYDSDTNPEGARCTIYDYMVNVFGRRAEDGFAARPYDNVGVEYGLDALLSGAIVPEQFVDLNEKVGGVSIDYTFQPQRSVADPGSLARAYQSGQVTDGTWLGQVPIVDSSYAVPAGDIHTPFHAWSVRERLLAANGRADTHNLRQGGGDRPPFEVMDDWLTGLEADAAAGEPAERIVRNRPADAVDNGNYMGTNPRIAAGGPLADNVLKCQLKPLDRDDYAGVAVPFTDAQWARFETAFPQGVCDWSRPGVDQQATIPWATYAAGDGPVALGPGPASEPFTQGSAPAGPAGTPLPATGGGGVVAMVLIVLAAAVTSRGRRASRTGATSSVGRQG